jgi:hypothetical protein
VYSCDACWRLTGTAGWSTPSSTSLLEDVGAGFVVLMMFLTMFRNRLLQSVAVLG